MYNIFLTLKEVNQTNLKTNFCSFWNSLVSENSKQAFPYHLAGINKFLLHIMTQNLRILLDPISDLFDIHLNFSNIELFGDLTLLHKFGEILGEQHFSELLFLEALFYNIVLDPKYFFLENFLVLVELFGADHIELFLYVLVIDFKV